MAQTILIDKLLQACVKQGASDIHITVGQPPVFRLHGRMRKLETKVLEPEDTVARELALFKVAADSETRGQVMQFAEIFRGSVIDVSTFTVCALPPEA